MKNSICKTVIILALFSILSLPVIAANKSISESNQDTITISFNDANPNFNKKFDTSNMAPGDKITQVYDLIINNNTDTDIKLEMKKTSPNSSPDLAEKLNVKIIAKINNKNNETIFDSTMNKFIKEPPILMLEKTSTNTQNIIFYIEVSLPVDTGNDYQGKNFTGDLQWSIYKDSTAFNSSTSDDGNIMLPCIFLIATICVIVGLKKIVLKNI